MELVKGSVPIQTKACLLPTLIATKLDLPPLKARMLERTDLLTRLRNGGNARLILISGEAASGKTSLAGQWLNEGALTAAWYSLDPDDNNPELFLRYFLTALGKRDAKFEFMIRPWLQSQQSFSIHEITPLIVQHYMDTHEDLFMVLDDYHLIEQDAVHGILSYLLAHLPPRLHLVILTRHSLPFPLSTLRMRGQLLEITAGELRFSQKEAERFLTDIMPCNLSEQQVREIFRQTEGWIGGLQLFGLAFKTNADLTGGQNNVYPIGLWTTDYLINEVIEVQDERTRNFILSTCLLDRFNSDLCREITGCGDAGEILGHLYQNNLFLVALDQGEWFRYHHLLSEVVRKQSLDEIPQTVLAIYRRAAQWFAQNGCPEDALRYAFATSDLEFAADMFEGLASALMDQYELSSLQRWMNRIPKSLRRERMGLLLCEASLSLEALQVTKAAAILEDIGNRQKHLLARYDDEGRLICEDFFRILKDLLAFRINPLMADVEERERQYRELSARNPSMALVFKVLTASCYVLQGKPRLGIEILQEVAWDIATSDIPHITMIWFKLMATAEIQRGRLVQAAAVLDKAVAYLERRGLSGSPLRFLVSVERAWIYFFQNKLAEAEKLIGECLPYTEAVNHDIATEAAFLQATLYSIRGQLDQAEQVLIRIRSAFRYKSAWLPIYDYCLAGIAALKGDQGKLSPWLEDRNFLNSEPSSLFDSVEYELYADLLFYLGRFQEATTMLNALRQWCALRDMGGFVLRIDVRLSAILAIIGEDEQAKVVLEKALSIADKEEYIRPFIDSAQPIAPILKRIAANLDSGISPRFLANILEARGESGNGAGINNGKSANGHDKLTGRELEILTLMAHGNKNREIAEKTFVSLDTVKTHIKHIFEKLHVETRVQAIRRAQELNIFRYQGEINPD